MRRRMTFPDASQNSASPYHLTVKALSVLQSVSVIQEVGKVIRNSQVQDNASCNYCRDRNVVAPIGQHQVEG
jgi:hypothetical protein